MQRRSNNSRRTSRVEPEPITGVRPIGQPEPDYKQAYEVAATYLRRAPRNVPRSERELIETDISNESAISRVGGLPR